MGVACIWLGVAANSSYTSFFLGRAFLGVFEAPIESIVPSTITDMFFLHERGEKVSIYGLSVLGGNELGPMLSAFIIQSLGMSWAFYIVAMAIAVNLVTMFFVMPETKFQGPRPTILAIDKSSEGHPEQTSPVREVFLGSATEDIVPEESYFQSLAFWGKSDPSVNLFKVFLAPFVLVAYPTVLWSCLIYGLALGWNVVLGCTVAQLFAPP